MAIVGGAVLLFSGATPSLSTRVRWLRHLVPLPIVEISHFFGSLAGASGIFFWPFGGATLGSCADAVTGARTMVAARRVAVRPMRAAGNLSAMCKV